MKIYLTLLILAIFGIITPSFSQKEEKIIHIKKSETSIKLDGILDEAVWQSANVADQFFLNRPYDSTFAKFQTHAKVTFDDKFIYVAFYVVEPKKNYTVSSLKRDFEPGSSDVVNIYIDPFKDKLNGFQFSVSPLNVQREGMISLGAEVDNTWDNKWYSAVKNYDDHWVAEMAIPFTTLRYKVVSGENAWRVNFSRAYMKENEISAWNPVPRNFSPSNLAFTGLMIWDNPPPKAGINISAIPYISGLYTKEYSRGDKLDLQKIDESKKITFGMDAKIAVTQSLNLDLTVNPDFSQVEVDQQQTNLSRFELYYPEKRQFFIENSDLFGKFGFPNTRPFFSRRIGLTEDPATGLVRQVPILAGARLSGKINEDWRIGLMNIQTKSKTYDEGNTLPSTNYSVATVQRKLFTRSSIGAILLNKENTITPATVGFNKFNRLAGLEFNYYSPDNKWETETYYHQSISPSNKKDAASMAQFVGYHHPHLNANLGLMRVGENFNAEMGYVPRTGVYNIFRSFTVILNPKNKNTAKKINAFGFGVDGGDVFDLKGKLLDTESAFFLFYNTPSNAEINIGRYISYTYLYSPFDPTNSSNNPNPDFSNNIIPLPIGGYHSNDFFMNITSSQKHNFFIKLQSWTGSYFGGTNSVIETTLNYRVQPYGKIKMDINYTNIKMPEPYKSAKYWLIGPKAEITFTKSLFFSTYFQYNTQTNNTNLNSRLQWRYKPVSDIFLVYTDNYFSESIPNYGISAWTPKNRAIILKMTYWLNI